MPTIDDYADKVTYHNRAPKFLAMLRASIAAPVAAADLASKLARVHYDLDQAIGVQLDAIGRWVGIGRDVVTPLPNIFFTFGDASLGYGAGVWKTPFDPTTGRTRLDDDSYRTLIRAKIAANHWDGTMAGAAAVMRFVFSKPDTRFFMSDNRDMTLSMSIAGARPTPIEQALFTSGLLPIRPGGVRIRYYNVVSVEGAPIFGFGQTNPRISGFGAGAWTDARAM